MNQPSNSGTTLLLELGDRVRRSWWTLIAGICFGLAGGTIALRYIPKVYEATTRIWINEQEIPEGVVGSTVKDEMTLKLAAFRTAVIADEYLIELIERIFGVPADDAELTARMNQVRDGLSIRPLESRQRGIQAFSLAYRDADPRRAADVVNTLTDLHVRQNTDLRKRSAVRIAGAIHTMAAKAKAEFDVIDTKLIHFKQAHQFETEQHLVANLRFLESRERDVDALNARRDLLRLDVRLAEEELVNAINQANAIGTTDTGAIVVDPLNYKIAQTKRELENLRVRYTDDHPDVRAKRRQLNDLLAQARNRPDPESDETGAPALSSNPVIASIQKRIQAIESQRAKMDSDERLLLNEIAEYERRIQVLPEIQRQLTELEEEHAVFREKWRKLERDAEGAKSSIVLEESDLAQSMEILTEASVPVSPIEPDPQRIYLVFLIASVVLFVGPMLARHAINPPITSEVGLRALTPIPVLISIPRITTPANRWLSRRNLVKNIALSVLAGAVLLSVEFYL